MAQIVKPEDAVAVTYQCQHISCRNAKCYKATITLSQQKFEQLCSAEAKEKHFRSPSGYCKLGGSQDFEILNIESDIVNTISPKDQVLSHEKALESLKVKQRSLQTEYQKETDKCTKEIAKITAKLKRARALLDQANGSTTP